MLGSNPFTTTIFHQTCPPSSPVGDSPVVCAPGDPERAPYLIQSLPVAVQSSIAGPGTQWETLPSVPLEVTRRPYIWFQPLLVAVCELFSWQRDEAGDMSAPQEILKDPTLGFSPSSHCQGPVQPTQEPGGDTSIHAFRVRSVELSHDYEN